MDLTKEQFAEMLGHLLEFWGFQKTAFAAAAGVDRSTIDEHLDPMKGQKVPRAPIRRGYERAAKLPTGYLDTYHDRETMRADCDKQRRDLDAAYASSRPLVVREPAIRYEGELEHPDDAGWMWGDPVLAEGVCRFIRQRGVGELSEDPATHYRGTDGREADRLSPRRKDRPHLPSRP